MIILKIKTQIVYFNQITTCEFVVERIAVKFVNEFLVNTAESSKPKVLEEFKVIIAESVLVFNGIGRVIVCDMRTFKPRGKLFEISNWDIVDIAATMINFARFRDNYGMFNGCLNNLRFIILKRLLNCGGRDDFNFAD